MNPDASQCRELATLASRHAGVVAIPRLSKASLMRTTAPPATDLAGRPMGIARPMHPQVRLAMTGESQHALFIMGRAVAAMRSAGLPEGERLTFLNEATAGNYDELLSTVRRWFTIT